MNDKSSAVLSVVLTPEQWRLVQEALRLGIKLCEHHEWSKQPLDYIEPKAYFAISDAQKALTMTSLIVAGGE